MERKPEEKSETSPYDEAWRSRVQADLTAHAAEQKRLWVGIDEQMLARHEAGLGTEEERALVEKAMREHPALLESMNMAREFSRESEIDRRAGQQENRGDRPWADHGDRPKNEPGKSR